MSTPKLPPRHISEITVEDLQAIEEMAANNKACKDMIKVLHFDARSFMREFRNKESELYEAYKRGQLQLAISEEDALIDQIAAGSITAIQISQNRRKEADFKNVLLDVFGI